MVSFGAIIPLVLTGNAILALALSLLGDFFAALPTLIKCFKHPKTETASAYVAEMVSSAIILLTIHNWTFVNYCFAASVLILNLVFAGLLLFPRKKLVLAPDTIN